MSGERDAVDLITTVGAGRKLASGDAQCRGGWSGSGGLLGPGGEGRWRPTDGWAYDRHRAAGGPLAVHGRRRPDPSGDAKRLRERGRSSAAGTQRATSSVRGGVQLVTADAASGIVRLAHRGVGAAAMHFRGARTSGGQPAQRADLAAKLRSELRRHRRRDQRRPGRLLLSARRAPRKGLKPLPPKACLIQQSTSGAIPT